MWKNILISLVILPGCVTFDRLPPQDLALLKEEAVTNKIAINFSNESVQRDEKEGKEESIDIKPIVEGYMLKSSGLFYSIQALHGKEDLYFEFKTVESWQDYHGIKPALMTTYKGISLLTLGILPYFERKPRILEVVVKKGQKVLKSYIYRHNIDYIMSIFVLPWWRPHKEDKRWSREYDSLKRIDEQLVRSFLKDFRKDFKL